jgi:hypothetical protein
MELIKKSICVHQRKSAAIGLWPERQTGQLLFFLCALSVLCDEFVFGPCFPAYFS